MRQIHNQSQAENVKLIGDLREEAEKVQQSIQVLEDDMQMTQKRLTDMTIKWKPRRSSSNVKYRCSRSKEATPPEKSYSSLAIDISIRAYLRLNM